AERHEAFLAALTAHMQLLAVEVDVRQVEPDRFRGAQTGGVDKLYERLVPQSQRAVALERVERRLDLSRLRRVWQTTMPSRRQRRVRHLRGAEREAEKAPDGCKLARDRRRRELARPCAAELRDEVGQHAHVDVCDAQLPVVEPA